jgi:hypothetical protein
VNTFETGGEHTKIVVTGGSGTSGGCRGAGLGGLVAVDLFPGGDPADDESAREVLLAYACAYPGLCPTDARAVLGPPDVWLRLAGSAGHPARGA